MVVSIVCELAPVLVRPLEELTLLTGWTLDGVGATLANGLAVLGHPVRREVLRLLGDHDHRHRTELAAAIVGAEHVDVDAAERLELLLHHSHLPKLAEHGYVEYDPCSGDATLVEAPESVEFPPDTG